MRPTVLKYGVGYDLVVVADQEKLRLAIRCHTCRRISFNPTDVYERYCGACHVFHEDSLLSHEA